MLKKFYQAILFDMDGVIIDTEQAVSQFWYKLAQVHQIQLTQADFEQHIYGCPATETLDVLFPNLTPTERRAVLAEMVDYEINQTYTSIRGVMPFLRSLKQYGIPTALVTSGATWKVEEVSRQLNLNGAFNAQVTVEDIRKGKPHPECYLLAAQQLRKAPEQCLVFEDSVQGMQAAVAAGTLAIGVQHSPNLATLLRQAGAWQVVPDFSSISLQAQTVDQREDQANLILQIGQQESLMLQPPN